MSHEKTLRIALPLLLALGPAAVSAAEPAGGAAGATNADAIVRTLEKVMYPDARTTLLLHFKSTGGRDENYEMVCFTRERNQKIIVRLTSPAEQVGNDILMLDQNVWTYDKAANRIMKVASNQSFGGTGFSYGDVVRLNFSDNYSAVLEGETAEEYRLALTAKTRSAPYHRIALAVSKSGGWPLRGTYYAQSGSVVKEVKYSDVKNVGTGAKPVTLTVSSPLDPGAVNVMTIAREETKSLPDRIFNKRNLETRMEDKL